MRAFFYALDNYSEPVDITEYEETTDNEPVQVPPNTEIVTTTATTNVITFPAYRIRFSNENSYTLFYQAMPFYHGKTSPDSRSPQALP